MCCAIVGRWNWRISLRPGQRFSRGVLHRRWLSPSLCHWLSMTGCRRSISRIHYLVAKITKTTVSHRIFTRFLYKWHSRNMIRRISIGINSNIMPLIRACQLKVAYKETKDLFQHIIGSSITLKWDKWNHRFIEDNIIDKYTGDQ
jgi:hypothetical protein